MNFNVMLIFEAAFYVLLSTYVESYRFKGLGVLVNVPAVPGTSIIYEYIHGNLNCFIIVCFTKYPGTM